MTTKPEEKFDVFQFFPDGSYEQVSSRVGPMEATRRALKLTETLGAKLGTTTRIIITDSGDNINFEWKFGQGVVYPPKES